LSTGREIDGPGHISRSLIAKVLEGFTAHILGRDNEEVIRDVSSIDPSDLRWLALDKSGGIDRETGLCENGTDESDKEGDGKECGEHGCSAEWIVGRGKEGINMYVPERI